MIIIMITYMIIIMITNMIIIMITNMIILMITNIITSDFCLIKSAKPVCRLACLIEFIRNVCWFVV